MPAIKKVRSRTNAKKIITTTPSKSFLLENIVFEIAKTAQKIITAITKDGMFEKISFITTFEK